MEVSSWALGAILFQDNVDVAVLRAGEGCVYNYLANPQKALKNVFLEEW